MFVQGFRVIFVRITLILSLNICPLSFPSKILFRNTSHWEKVLCLCDIIVKRSYSERQFYGQPIIGNDLLVSIESLYRKKKKCVWHTYFLLLNLTLMNVCVMLYLSLFFGLHINIYLQFC